MTPSPDPAAEPTQPVSNLSTLYKQQQQQHKHNNTLDSAQARGRHISRYELGRRDRHGERVTRIYPREM